MFHLPKLPNLALVLFFALIVALFCAIAPAFRTIGNFEDILSGFSHIAILSVGEAFPILLRGIDLSVGSIMAVSGMVAFDLVLIFHWPGALVLPLTLLVGTLCGVLNGVLIVNLRLRPFIATLATMASLRGLTYMISGRKIFPELATQSIDDPLLLGLDNYWGHFHYSFLVLIAVVMLAQVLLSRTRFGLDLFTVGGNPEAARLAGIKTARAIYFGYGFSGFCAGLAAILLMARMTTTTEALGTGSELSAIAAAIIGGGSLAGGIGGAFGPAIGAFLMGVLLIGLNMTGIPTYSQPVVTGFVLLGAVLYDRYLVRRRAGATARRSVARASS